MCVYVCLCVRRLWSGANSTTRHTTSSPPVPSAHWLSRISAALSYVHGGEYVCVCVCAFVRVRACALAVIQHSLARLWKVIAPHSSALALSCVSTLLAGGGCRMFGGADWHGKERSRCSGCVVGCSAMQNVPLTVRCGVQRNSTMSTPPRRR
jgi:hypothetical protein